MQGQWLLRLGSGVICKTWALQVAVIPAKAGIQSVHGGIPRASAVDSRFHGNDRRLERYPIPNDTNTLRRNPLT
jgi:hypothetical protein